MLADWSPAVELAVDADVRPRRAARQRRGGVVAPTRRSSTWRERRRTCSPAPAWWTPCSRGRTARRTAAGCCGSRRATPGRSTRTLVVRRRPPVAEDHLQAAREHHGAQRRERDGGRDRLGHAARGSSMARVKTSRDFTTGLANPPASLGDGRRTATARTSPASMGSNQPETARRGAGRQVRQPARARRTRAGRPPRTCCWRCSGRWPTAPPTASTSSTCRSATRSTRAPRPTRWCRRWKPRCAPASWWWCRPATSARTPTPARLATPASRRPATRRRR